MLLLLNIALISSGIYASNIPSYSTKWFPQILNHFNPQDNRTFQQRYLIYNKSWNKNNSSPIFVYAGNEAPIDAFWNNTGFMFDIVNEFNALIIFIEHRYYGQSLPFGNITSFNRDNMKYLTVENAVADYANLINELKTTIYNVPNSKVIVFGGSYGGILSALCRIHYPSIFDISLAASAPINMMLNTYNYSLLFQYVTQSYDNVDTKCPNIVRNGYKTLLDYAKVDNYNEISNTFKLCGNNAIKNQNDIQNLLMWTRNAFMSMSMLNYPYSTNVLGSLPAWPANKSCEMMLNVSSKTDNNMLALAIGSSLYYNASSNYSSKCYNISELYAPCEVLHGCKPGPFYNLAANSVVYDYQWCTQLIVTQNTNNISDMFWPQIWDIHNITKYCMDKYNVVPDLNWMKIWMPLDIKKLNGTINRIIFSNGLLDPIRSGGYMESVGYELPAVIIQEAAHHLDLRGSNVNDPMYVTDARKIEVNYFKQWLNMV